MECSWSHLSTSLKVPPRRLRRVLFPTILARSSFSSSFLRVLTPPNPSARFGRASPESRSKVALLRAERGAIRVIFRIPPYTLVSPSVAQASHTSSSIRARPTEVVRDPSCWRTVPWKRCCPMEPHREGTDGSR